MKRLLKRLWLKLTGKPHQIELPGESGEHTGPRPKGPVPHLPTSSRGERNLIIGVDFGTSSTKVIWQDLSDNHFELFRWNAVTLGLTAFLLPSTVVIRGGAIHFAR